MDVQVARKNIAINGSSGFAANMGSSSFEREATGAQDAKAGTTERVNGTAAATGCTASSGKCSRTFAGEERTDREGFGSRSPMHQCHQQKGQCSWDSYRFRVGVGA